MPDLAGWVGKSMVVGVSYNLDLDHCVPKSLGPAEVYGMLFYFYVGREKQHFGLWDVFGMVFPGNKKLEPHTRIFWWCWPHWNARTVHLVELPYLSVILVSSQHLVGHLLDISFIFTLDDEHNNNVLGTAQPPCAARWLPFLVDLVYPNLVLSKARGSLKPNGWVMVNSSLCLRWLPKL